MTAARERIVEEALRLFLTRGYDRTSMAELVRATGLSKGALYHHFSGKAALRDAVVEHFWLRHMTDDGADIRHRPLAEVLHSLAAGYADLLETVASIAGDPMAYYRFVLDALPGTREPFIATLKRTHQTVSAAAARAQDAGVIGSALPPDRVAETALGLIEGTGLLCGFDPQRNPRRDLAAAVDDVLALLSAAPAARSVAHDSDR